MSVHITRYKTENGKTRKAKSPAAKPAGKNGAPEPDSGAASKNNPPAAPAKKEQP
jgi:hypothetical protein